MAAPIFCRNHLISGDKWLLPFSVEINLYQGINDCSHFLKKSTYIRDKWLLPFSGLSPPLSSHVPGLWLSELHCTSLHQEETRIKMKKVDEEKVAKDINIFVGAQRFGWTNVFSIHYGLGLSDGQSTSWTLNALRRLVKIVTVPKLMTKQETAENKQRQLKITCRYNHWLDA